MLDFLLKKEKQAIKKEYLFRFINILLLAMSAVLIFGFTIKSNTFFLLQKQNAEISEKINNFKNTENVVKYDELQRVNENIGRQLKNFDSRNLNYYTLINFIEESAPDGVIVNTLSINKSVTTTGEETKYDVKISGNAESRNKLVSFINRLKSENLFEDVNLPLSSLASDSDIKFTLDLIINNKNSKNYE